MSEALKAAQAGWHGERSSSAGSWVPHPTWLCLCGMGPWGRHVFLLKHCKMRNSWVPPVWGGHAASSCLYPTQLHGCHGRGCVPQAFLGSQCACTGWGTCWGSITPLIALGLSMVTPFTSLPHPQPHTASGFLMPVPPHPAKMRRQQVCLRLTPQSWIWHFWMGYMTAQKPPKKSYALAKGRLLPPPAC